MNLTISHIYTLYVVQIKGGLKESKFIVTVSRPIPFEKLVGDV